MKTIPGALDYRALAELHKPRTAEGLQEAARDLACRGFSDHGIAHALALDVQAVRAMLAASAEEAAAAHAEAWR
jgi:hypothetical protein